MKSFPFELETSESLIHVQCKLTGEYYYLALDTGASSTVIDLAVMIMAGYNISDAIETVELETGKGSIEAYVFQVKQLEALGIIQRDIKVCSYDFFGHSVFYDIHGILGLDFFKGRDLLISFKRFEIMVS